MGVKTERITILGTPDFKAFLASEAKAAGVSISQLVRNRCERKSDDADEALLLELVAQVRTSSERAEESLNKGVETAERVLQELRAS